MNKPFFPRAWALLFCLILAPHLSARSPSGNSLLSTRSPAFTWPSVSGATWYQVWVNRDGQTHHSQWVEGDVSWTTPQDWPGGNYSWWVRGWGPSVGYTAWSAAATFRISVQTPVALTLVAPQGPQGSGALAYRWERDANATWYRLWVGASGGATWHDRWFEIRGTGETSVTPASQVTPRGAPAVTSPTGHGGTLPTFTWKGGQYSWWLRAWGPDGFGPWSGPGNFTRPHPPGTWHRVYVSRAGIMVLDQWTQESSLPSPVQLSPGSHSWWLGVWDPSTGRTLWSGRTDFLVGMARIPAGWFTMGRTSGDTDSNAPPVNVYVSEFYMARHQVTWALWNDVRDWAVNHGYTDIATGGGKGATHPVHSVSWWDVVKWLNAWSERERLDPVYRNANGTVFKTGTTAPTASWNANGYRLPTEAEWEKAARGGVSGQRFPWGNEINHSHANYSAHGSAYTYDTSPYTTATYHPTYATGNEPYTSPVGSFAANGYGLYDMSGNVGEWCWDWYSASTYTGNLTDPRGPSSGTSRVKRGSSWLNVAWLSRSSSRGWNSPSGRISGFRPARSSVP